MKSNIHIEKWSNPPYENNNLSLKTHYDNYDFINNIINLQSTANKTTKFNITYEENQNLVIFYGCIVTEVNYNNIINSNYTEIDLTLMFDFFKIETDIKLLRKEKLKQIKTRLENS